LSTYRIQFHPGFRFAHAAEILQYLRDLGISHLYASPVFRARRGSMHGYDAVDLNEINPELGSVEELETLFSGLRERGMGWIQDFAANHMAFHKDNPLLMDVLESGGDSIYRDFFDIDWDHPYEGMKGKVLAPFLGSLSGDALEKGELKLHYGPDGLSIRYHELEFPVAVSSYTGFFSHGIDRLKKSFGEEDLAWIQYLGILYVLRTIPSMDGLEEREFQIRFIKRSLWALYMREGRIRDFVDSNIRIFNGRPDDKNSFDLLEGLLLEQNYRLSYWKVATEEINYRRFFNINELICLRQEKKEVFEATHALVFGWLEHGKISGLRIDHLDGFYAPYEYLNAIREKNPDKYVVVEKILDAGEQLPDGFPVQGTTGYDFLNRLNELFCSSRNRRGLTSTYQRFTREASEPGSLVVQKRRLIIGREMAGEIENLARRLKNIAAEDRFARDITMNALKTSLIEILVRFPVYRTYVRPQGLSRSDRRSMEAALQGAGADNPDLHEVLGFLERFLLLYDWESFSDEKKAHRLDFVRRFQQLTGPLMAKGFEDTALYVYNRFVSVNEVGGDLDRIGQSPRQLHAFVQNRFKKWPHTMNATASHDTKRGEDVRARLNVLSELSREWSAEVRAWRGLNRHLKTRVKRRLAPDANDEYFLYQSLLGSWPLLEEELPDYGARVRNYIIKAVREAKVHTTWVQPDTAYEEACIAFFDGLMRGPGENPFLERFAPFCARVSRLGLVNSLSQLVLKLTLPGVPDMYQGTELWDFSLVDPDNRRPVDFNRRKAMIRTIRSREERDPEGLIKEMLDHPQDGLLKMYVTRRLLHTRSTSPELFLVGRYTPLKVTGPHRSNAFAFTRSLEDKQLAVVVPRLPVGLDPDGGWPIGEQAWGDTRVAFPSNHPGIATDLLTGRVMETVPSLGLGELMRKMPLAVFMSNAP